MPSPTMPSDPLAVVVAGDLDGDIRRTCEALSWAHREGAGALLALGNIGLGPPGPQTDRFLGTVSAVACEYAIPLLWVDGADDHHDSLASHALDPNDGLRHLRPGVVHLPRGFRWRWGGRTWLALGGGPATLSAEAAAHAIADGPADVVVTHDTPDRVPAPDCADDVREHRVRIGSVVDGVGAGLALHGSVGVRRVELRDRIDGATTTVLGLASANAPTADHAILVRIPQTFRTEWSPR